MSYRATEFKKLNNEFAEAAQPILEETDLSIKALENLLDTYNAIIVYAEIDFDRKKKQTKEHIKSVIEVNRVTLQRCYEKLNLTLSLPGAILSTIHYIPQKSVSPKPIPKTDQLTQTEQILNSQSSSQTDKILQSINFTQTEQIPNSINSSQTEPILTVTNFTQTDRKTKSKMEKAEFLKLCGTQINKNYSGDPLSLQSFIRQINLLKNVGETHLETLTLFVHAKLTGKALESVREDPKSVDEIVADLKKYIKPDNSRVIESQIQGLKFNANKGQEFIDQAEELAEALQRTLIIEGISQEKAREMTVERTIELCRQTAKTDSVSTILASTQFQTPKDVLAKFLVENSRERNNKQILAIRQQGNRTNNFSNNFQNRNTNGHRGRGSSNGNRQRVFHNNNYQNNSNGNNYRNYRGNNRNFHSNQRGRGGFRNNYSNYNHNNNERYVRMVAENYHGPSDGRAETQNTQTNQPTILRIAHSNQ